MSSLRLGSPAPNFQANTTHGPIDFHEWRGNSWAILFSHPDDFTPVCTTELAEIATNQGCFDDRNVKVIGLSVNDIASHQAWVKDINDLSGAPVTFPIIGDKDRKIATLYNMLDAVDPNNVEGKVSLLTVRTVFLIDPKGTIRFTVSYPASTGRHISEILRIIDSLQLGDKYQIITPVNWRKGEKVLIHPSVQGEDVKLLFPDAQMIKPYLRYTKDPLYAPKRRPKKLKDVLDGC